MRRFGSSAEKFNDVPILLKRLFEVARGLPGDDAHIRSRYIEADPDGEWRRQCGKITYFDGRLLAVKYRNDRGQSHDQ